MTSDASRDLGEMPRSPRYRGENTPRGTQAGLPRIVQTMFRFFLVSNRSGMNATWREQQRAKLKQAIHAEVLHGQVILPVWKNCVRIHTHLGQGKRCVQHDARRASSLHRESTQETP